MDVFKQFVFADGWRCEVAVREGVTTFDMIRGETRLHAACRDLLFLGGANRAQLLGGRIGVEETEDSLLLHACPVDEATNAPIPALMAHYRFEKAGENALRVTTWFAGDRPVMAHHLDWLRLELLRGEVRECVGLDPEYRFAPQAIGHEVRFENLALRGERGYLLMTDSGGALYRAQAESETGAEACSLLAAGCAGTAVQGDLTLIDRAHPLSAVIAFGECEPVSPAYQPLRLPEAEPVRGRVYTLVSGALRMSVAVREDGASILPVSLDDASSAPKWTRFPLARVLVRDLTSGETLALTAERGWARVTARSSEKRLSLYLERPRGIDLCLSVEGRAVDGDAIEWRTRVLNQSERYTVLSVTYPGVNFEGGGPVSLFTPSDSGRVIENAYSVEASFAGTYPSGFEGVAPVLGVYGARNGGMNGLYAAVHDRSGARKELSCALTRGGHGSMGFEYPAECLGRPRNSFEAGGCLVVKAFSGDWYDMAKIYKRFAETCDWYAPLGREDSPAWMRDVPMYIMDWMPNDNPDADPVPVSVRPPVEPPRDNWYKKPIELAEYLGLPIGYHLYNWHWIPFNNDYPYYFPVKEGLLEGVLAMQEHGVHVMPYINGRIADTRDSRGEVVRFDRELRPGATKGLGGELDIETYASHEPDGSLCRLAAMCPTSPAWRDLMAETVSRLFREYHMDAVYIDQVAAARMNLCCDPTHGHTPGNGDWWVKGYRLLMERLRRECPEGRGFTTESNAEVYVDQFDGFLTWAWVRTSLVPFFPKVYAGRVALLGRNTNGYKKNDAQFFRFHVGQAVLFGQQIGWINADVVDNPEKNDYLRRMCHVRWDYKDFFSRGEMLRPPVVVEGQKTYLSDVSMGMSEMHPAELVLAAAWRLDSRTLILLTNTSDEPVQAIVAYDQAELDVSDQPEERAYGGARCLSARPGTLRVELGPRSALAWG